MGALSSMIGQNSYERPSRTNRRVLEGSSALGPPRPRRPKVKNKEARKTHHAHSRSEVPTGVSLYPASVNSWHTEFATMIPSDPSSCINSLSLDA